jgi:hypothetical protein
MTRYRIVKRGGLANPTKAYYDVEEQVLCFWFWQNTFTKLESAEALVKDLQAQDRRIKRQVVGEYEE